MRTILAFPADGHSASTTGLMKPEPWNREAGGTYTPTLVQRLIYRQWIEGWERVRELRKRSRLIVTVTGDAVDGDHHDTNEIFTRSRNEQERVHIETMEDALDIAKFNSKKGDILQYLKGTPVHVATSEEAIARDLGARPARKPTSPLKKDGRFVHYHLRFNVNGVPFDVAHEGGRKGTRAWTRENGLILTARSLYFDSIEYKRTLPRWWIRGHIHTYLNVPFQRRDKIINMVTLPCFQAKTEYGVKFTQGTLEPPTIGMFIVVVEDNGHSWCECPQFVLPAEKFEDL